jgi:hypothetical protein
MNNIIGPIPHDDWYLMRMLRESISHMAKIDPNKYRYIIAKQTDTYKDMLYSYTRNRTVDIAA